MFNTTGRDRGALSEMTYTKFETPLGPVFVEVAGGSIRSFSFGRQKDRQTKSGWAGADKEVLRSLEAQLTEYFEGRRVQFDLPLVVQATAFQKRVWTEVSRVPLGQLITYGELARRIGKPQAQRAVGTALGQNPTCLLVPCHRVIASNGRLGGYSGGLEIKRKLVDFELYSAAAC